MTAAGEAKLAEQTVTEPHPCSHILEIAEAFAAQRLPAPHAVGHRFVHGGPHFQRTTLIDAAVLASLRVAVPYAPLHLPAEIEAVEALAGRYPRAPQYACFDTAFHRQMPEVARHFPLPWAMHEQGIRRYGFHGLSYEYVVESCGSALGRRSIIAHLGNGASMVALRDLRPIDTTMGLTPAGGLMMGTRTGDFDPGVLLHLLDLGHSAGDLDRMLNHESGLLGVSGITADMKVLLSRRSTDVRAALAIEMFCYQARKSIGAFTAALGGLDSLVFTGGIGEHSPAIREEIVRGLSAFGIKLDPGRNDRAEPIISEEGSPCTVRVISTNEESPSRGTCGGRSSPAEPRGTDGAQRLRWRRSFCGIPRPIPGSSFVQWARGSARNMLSLRSMNGTHGDAEHPILVTRNVHADGTYSLSLRVACPVRSEAVPLAMCRTCPRCSEIGCNAEGCETSVRCSSGRSGGHSDIPSVGDALKRGALVVDDNTSIKDIVSLFVERGLRFAVVTEPSGQVSGVLHESHLIAHLREKTGGREPEVALRWRLEREEPASTVMSTPLCVHESTPFAQP